MKAFRCLILGVSLGLGVGSCAKASHRPDPAIRNPNLGESANDANGREFSAPVRGNSRRLAERNPQSAIRNPQSEETSAELAGVAQRIMAGQEGVLLLATVPEGRRLAEAGTLALADQPFPAGSVFKVVTAFAAAQELPLDLSQTIPCRGVYRVGQKRFHCSVPGGHGPLSLVEALAQSCNVHFYVLARRIGPATLARYALQLGWPAHRLDLTDTGDAEGTLRFGIGQRGVTITPREMLDWVVHLARNVSVSTAAGPAAPAGQTDQTDQTDQAHVSASTAAGPAAPGTLRERQAFQVIAQGLRQAVAQGTARRAGLPDVAVAAKTGSPTSVQDPTRLQAWCVGYAPAEAPEVAFVVFVKDGMGGTTAAPLAGSVLRACFHPCKP